MGDNRHRHVRQRSFLMWMLCVAGVAAVTLIIASVEVARASNNRVASVNSDRVARAKSPLLSLRRCSSAVTFGSAITIETWATTDITNIHMDMTFDDVWSEGVGTAVVVRRALRPMTSLPHDTVFLTTLAQVCEGYFACWLCLSASTCHCLTLHFAAASTIKP